MFEKILQKLKEQRGKTSNVSDRSLEDLARTLVPIITTDDLLETSDFSATISSIDGNINHYTAEQVKKTQEKIEQERIKADEKAKKAAEKKAADEKAKKEGKTVEPDTPEWAKALIEQNQKLASDMIALKGEKVHATRSDKLQEVLKDTPEYLQNPIKASFGLMKFENDEAFTSYLETVEKEKITFLQAAKEQGLNISSPAVDVTVPKDDGQTKELSVARDIAKKQKVKLKQLENGTD